MRTTTRAQLQLGEIDIADIEIDTRSRDDIPQLLLGLQLFTPEILDEINQVVVRAGHKLKKKTRWRDAAIHLWLKRMCTIQPISICCWMRYAK
jgi:hypothetical protein